MHIGSGGLKINVGCGSDKKDGYVNIDGVKELEPDIVMRLPQDSLLDRFSPASVHEVMMIDFLEHHFRWEAEKILKEIYIILVPNGKINIRVPNFVNIVFNFRISWEQKIRLLWGGQDIGNEANDDLRIKYPEFYCHKYGYTKSSLTSILKKIGFVCISVKSEGTNFWTTAIK
jgi:hypothetical protein